MCLSVRFASSVAARWSAGVAEHRFESQRNSRNVLSSSETHVCFNTRGGGGEYSYIHRVENRIGIGYMREREREREDVCLYLRALRKSMTTKPFSTHREEEEVEEEDEARRLVS